MAPPPTEERPQLAAITRRREAAEKRRAHVQALAARPRHAQRETWHTELAPSAHAQVFDLGAPAAPLSADELASRGHTHESTLCAVEALHPSSPLPAAAANGEATAGSPPSPRRELLGYPPAGRGGGRRSTVARSIAAQERARAQQRGSMAVGVEVEVVPAAQEEGRGGAAAAARQLTGSADTPPTTPTARSNGVGGLTDSPGDGVLMVLGRVTGVRRGWSSSSCPPPSASRGRQHCLELALRYEPPSTAEEGGKAVGAAVVNLRAASERERDGWVAALAAVQVLQEAAAAAAAARANGEAGPPPPPPPGVGQGRPTAVPRSPLSPAASPTPMERTRSSARLGAEQRRRRSAGRSSSARRRKSAPEPEPEPESSGPSAEQQPMPPDGLDPWGRPQLHIDALTGQAVTARRQAPSQHRPPPPQLGLDGSVHSVTGVHSDPALANPELGAFAVRRQGGGRVFLDPPFDAAVLTGSCLPSDVARGVLVTESKDSTVG
jgi:hypothetical protein